jgi:hypothetical protein
MTTVRKFLFFILACSFLVLDNPVSYTLRGSWTSTAQAIIGRPATPVSVAGVARRTTRRCAAGVYRCY